MTNGICSITFFPTISSIYLSRLTKLSKRPAAERLRPKSYGERLLYTKGSNLKHRSLLMRLKSFGKCSQHQIELGIIIRHKTFPPYRTTKELYHESRIVALFCFLFYWFLLDKSEETFERIQQQKIRDYFFRSYGFLVETVDFKSPAKIAEYHEAVAKDLETT
jgi:hypothetical protein